MTVVETVMDDKGYVIRCLDLIDGSVYYRGRNGLYAGTKEGLTTGDTYTLSGAKRALSNLRKQYSDPEKYQYSIERLDEYYVQIEPIRPDAEKVRKAIDHAMKRLDELWDGNNFDNGDKMRINEVRTVLRILREKM